MAAEGSGLRGITEANHILFNYSTRGFYRVVQLLGWQGPALKPIQVLNAFFGALSVALMFSISARITKSLIASLITSTGFAVSAGVWLFSTDSESVVIPLVATLIVLMALVIERPSPASPKSPFVLGSLVFLAVMIYQTSVLLVFSVIAGYLSADGLSLRMRRRQSVRFLAVAGLASMVTYASLAIAIVGVRSVHELAAWQLNMSSYDLWGKWEFRKALPGASRALIAFPSLSEAPPNLKVPVIAVACLALLVLISPLIAAYKMRVQLISEHRRILSICGAWAGRYGLFTVCWVAADSSFWVPVLIPWWILVSLTLTAGDNFWSTPRRRLSVAFVVVLLIAGLNYILALRPSREVTCDYRLAEAIGAETSPKDLVVSTGADRSALYIPYFSHRRTLPVHLWLLGRREILDAQGLVSAETADSKFVGTRSKQDVYDAIEKEIEHVKKGGGRVILVGMYPPGDSRWKKWDLAQPDDFQRFATRGIGNMCGSRILEIIG